MRGCPNPHKIRYLTRKDGKLALRQQRGRGRLRDGHTCVYLCRCGFFHIGRLPAYTVAGYALTRLNGRPPANA